MMKGQVIKGCFLLPAEMRTNFPFPLSLSESQEACLGKVHSMPIPHTVNRLTEGDLSVKAIFNYQAYPEWG